MDKPKYLTRNRYGISIVKCCASCKHKQADSRVRLCLNGEGAVPPYYLCGDWEMSEGLKKAGKGGGKVKKQAFLNHAINAHFRENANAVEAANNNRPYMRMTREEMRKEYERMHGSIYYDM